MNQLAEMGELFRIAQDHYFTREAVAQLSKIARELAESEGEARAAAFRDRIGGGRKVAIHILEFFDRVGYSRRLGDGHRVHRDTLLEFNCHGRRELDRYYHPRSPPDVRPIMQPVLSWKRFVPRWDGRTSNPERAARRPLVGSTPTLFRHFPRVMTHRRTPAIEDPPL